MAVIKCKMCGGDLKVVEGESVCECEYCGSRQTVPSADNEKKMTLFSRASRLLRNCEFDKAAGVFESIIADFPEEAEAYWCLVLCKYGIEYVDDPGTGKKVPTCHRSSFDSVLDDSNFEQACENADVVARRVYRDEARAIEELRKGIIEVSGKEEPYDIFISYKETDGNGDRTLDSVIAQDIYTELTEKGYRVFFSRISLEGKLGIEYEPYIFAALNSAKVMIVVGTDYENFDAVWVKNEWSRFLKLIASGQKKTLIPAFKNMDAYDMPKEFAKLSAQDMGKVGAMQDLLRGVEKLIPRKKQENAQKEKVTEKVIVQQQSEGSMKTDAAIKRGMMALEDGEWEKAKEYYDQALMLDAENAKAYFGLALADFQAKDPDSFIKYATAQKPSTEEHQISKNTEHIKKTTSGNEIPHFLNESDIIPLYGYDLSYPSTVKGQKEIQTQVRKQIDSNRNLSRALRFAEGEEKARIEGFKKTLFEELQKKVDEAKKQEEEARNRLKQQYEAFLKETDNKVQEMNSSACREREEVYQKACDLQQSSKIVSDYQDTIEMFKPLSGFKDVDQRIEQCIKSIEGIQEAERREKEKFEEEEKERIYQDACKKLDNADYKYEVDDAQKLFEKIQGYKDSSSRIVQCRNRIEDLEDQKRREKAEKEEKQRKTKIVFALLALAVVVAFFVINNIIIPRNKYNEAEQLLASGDKTHAAMLFGSISYKDAKERSFALWDEIVHKKTIAAGWTQSFAIPRTGTVMVTEPASSNSLMFAADGARKWAGIISIDACDAVAVGLEEKRTVVVEPTNGYDVEKWKNIVDISAGAEHVVGLKADGTVIAAGKNRDGCCNVNEWEDIIAVAAYGKDLIGMEEARTFGLKADGTVIAVGTNKRGEINIAGWKNVVEISGSSAGTVALKSDGTVYIAGFSDDLKKEVEAWKNVISVKAGERFVIGLMENGTVACAGGGTDIIFTNDWKDVVEIAAGSYHALGLKSDGTVVATGDEEHGQKKVAEWGTIRLP